MSKLTNINKQTLNILLIISVQQVLVLLVETEGKMIAVVHNSHINESNL